MGRPKILLTNDDGINSSAIWAAYDALSEFADVTVVAPAVQQSAVGRSISIFEPLRLNKIKISGHDAYVAEGRPTDALLLGLYALNLNPDLVVSGINLGENISYESINTSGTVGAAMEAANQNVPSIAFSLEMKNDGDKFIDPRVKENNFSQAKEVVSKVVKYFMKNGLPKNCHLLNVNIPDAEIKGYRSTILGTRLFDTSVEKRLDPRGKPYYWICGKPIYIEEENSDVTALREGYVSVTPLTMDNTAYKACKELEKMIDGF
ncbi:MAG: 5'/3'-nucleotidase SurE [Methanocorpusculum sp.]|nr:5'/3'-nucleotidase SurE [Methanocorpusculum sp.]